MSPDGDPPRAPADPERGAAGSTEPPDDRPIGELVLDVSERVSTLVQDEIALAKAEIFEKVAKILRGSAVGIAAGVFVLLGLAMLMHAFAWLLNDLFFGDTIWLGFLVEAVLFFVIAVLAGLFAYRSVKAGAPPTPDMAIEEGRRIKQTLDSSTTPAPRGAEPGASWEGDPR